ncbi:MAG TPA: ribosome maturation factor RimM [Xanthobacteraceae bacterium]|jgi:16S rRNA processing protein RimM|nr:ribosome maturation factor RimM [Xanthobacteraceae bacterium]
MKRPENRTARRPPLAETPAQGRGARRICVARIGAPHGVRGDVKLWSFTADPQAVLRYGPLETADGLRAFEIESARTAKDHLVVRLKGISDRTAAEALRNVELFVPRARLPDTADADEFYHADLVGLAVVDTNGNVLGEVAAVYNFGAGDVLEIRRPDGGGTEMLPFTTQVVPVVDVEGGRLVVDPPEGTFEPPAAGRKRPVSAGPA